MLTSTVADRSAARLALIAADEHVETNPAYAAHDGLTWCNVFARNVARRLNAPLPEGLINDVITWLAGPAGAAAGWECVPEHVAGAMADAGQLVLATYRNPTGHGHVAVVMPSLGDAGLFVAQAGANNFTRGPISRGFGSLPVTFFGHP